MRELAATWQFWALLSAVFAALTAILAKVGVEGVTPDLATFIRTVVILLVRWLKVKENRARAARWMEERPVFRTLLATGRRP